MCSYSIRIEQLGITRWRWQLNLNDRPVRRAVAPTETMAKAAVLEAYQAALASDVGTGTGEIDQGQRRIA